jgi:hypothetical protein
MLLNWRDSNPTAKQLCPLLGGCWMLKLIIGAVIVVAVYFALRYIAVKYFGSG